MKKKILLFFVVFLGLIAAAGIGIKSRNFSAEDQAAFNVDVLERFVSIYKKGHGQYPRTLQDLPGFEVVSYQQGLKIDSRWFQDDRPVRGYRYHYFSNGADDFVISASPVGILKAKKEFGITAQGVLKINDYRVDAKADSAAEVRSWLAIGRRENIFSVKKDG